MPKTLFLIDGHAHIHRAFHAVEGLRAPDGRPTGAVFGFTRMLLDLTRKHQPECIAAVFDSPGPTFRHVRFSEYKANRSATAPELLQQIPLVHEVVRAFNIPVLAVPGFEADDILGTVARRAADEGYDVVLVTGDKDCGQLLSGRIRMYDHYKDAFTTAESFEAQKGIRPTQLVDLMGLWGDTSDNIPGVPGIGEKIGIELIRKYGTLEKLLHHGDEIKGKRGEKIRECADVALLSKELATIRTDVPVEVDLAGLAHRPPDSERLRALFEELGFRSLQKELADELPEVGLVRDEKRKYVLVNTPEQFHAFLTALKVEEEFALDTETTALDPMHCRLVGMSFSWEPKSGYYLPFRAPKGEPVLSPSSLEQLKPILENPRIRKVGQNLKYDTLVLRRHGIHLQGIAFDTLLASSILTGHVREHGLDSLAPRYLGVQTIPITDVIGSGRDQKTMDEAPTEQVCEYACEDADVALRLRDVLARELDKRDERHLHDEIELPLSLVLTDMQQTGVRVDRALLEAQSRDISHLLTALIEEIHKLAGREFNVASPKQLAEVLFEDMGLPVLRKTKTGPSTDESVLNELALQGHELPRAVLEYRAYAKLKSTYLDALPSLINPETGRIHTTFTQTATATGRLSSRDPNLQNIPVRSERGQAVREAFLPAKGWKMLAADYSQVELRILAHYSGDPMLRQAFAENRDIHRVVASEVNDVDEDEVTSEMRAAAKAINFGIIYGQSAHGLSQTTDMTIGQARLFIDAYFERFPRVREFIDDTLFQARNDGFVRTIKGRRREIPELRSMNKMRLARAEREAVNTVIQGSAADLIKIAMIRIHERMRHETPQSRMLLQIHDELVFEAPPAEVDALRDLVREEMENALPLDVPLTVSLGTGDNWLEVK